MLMCILDVEVITFVFMGQIRLKKTAFVFLPFDILQY